MASQTILTTPAGRKIALMDVEDCIISVQTSSGKELARIQGGDFSMHKAIAQFHAELTESYGSLMRAGKITEITADTFNVHVSTVKRCVQRHYKEKINHAAQQS